MLPTTTLDGVHRHCAAVATARACRSHKRASRQRADGGTGSCSPPVAHTPEPTRAARCAGVRANDARSPAHDDGIAGDIFLGHERHCSANLVFPPRAHSLEGAAPQTPRSLAHWARIDLITSTEPRTALKGGAGPLARINLWTDAPLRLLSSRAVSCTSARHCSHRYARSQCAARICPSLSATKRPALIAPRQKYFSETVPPNLHNKTKNSPNSATGSSRC